MTQNHNAVWEISEKIALFFLAVFCLDFCVLGSAQVFDIGPVSFHMLLAGLVILFSIPAVCLRWRELVRSLFFLLLVLLALVLAINAVRGFIGGHSRYVLSSDLRKFAYFALFPSIFCLVASRQRLRMLARVICAGGLLLALTVLIMNLWHPVNDPVWPHLNAWINGSLFALIFPISDTLFRFQPFSAMSMACSCGLFLYFYVRSSSRARFLYPIGSGICLISLLLTFSRAVYVGVLVAAVAAVAGLLLVYPKSRLKLLGGLGIAVLSFGVILASVNTLNHTDVMQVALDRTFGGMTGISDSVTPGKSSSSPDGGDSSSKAESSSSQGGTESVSSGPGSANSELSKDELYDDYEYTQEIQQESDEYRQNLEASLIQDFLKNPVFGNGLGLAAQSADGLVEYTFLDLLVKIGVVGLLVFLAPALLMGVQFIRWLARGRTKEKDCPAAGLFAVLFACVLGTMATSYFNPAILGALGLTLYSLSMVSFGLANEELDQRNTGNRLYAGLHAGRRN